MNPGARSSWVRKTRMAAPPNEILKALAGIRDAAPSSNLAFEWVGDDVKRWKRVKLDDSSQELVEL